MIERVHMLFAGMIACKGPVATFTFKHGWQMVTMCARARNIGDVGVRNSRRDLKGSGLK